MVMSVSDIIAIRCNIFQSLFPCLQWCNELNIAVVVHTGIIIGSVSAAAPAPIAVVGGPSSINCANNVGRDIFRCIYNFPVAGNQRVLKLVTACKLTLKVGELEEEELCQHLVLPVFFANLREQTTTNA